MKYLNEVDSCSQIDITDIYIKETFQVSEPVDYLKSCLVETPNYDDPKTIECLNRSEALPHAFIK